MSYQGRADQNKSGSDHCKHQNLQLQLYESDFNSPYRIMTKSRIHLSMNQCRPNSGPVTKSAYYLSDVVGRIGLTAIVTLQFSGCRTEKAAR